MAKKPKFTFVTPLAVATLAYIDKPDDYTPPGAKDKAEPKYKITLVFPEGTDMAAYEAKALEAIKAEWPKAKPASVKSALKSGTEMNDAREEKDKERLDLLEGAVVIRANSKFQPEVRNAKKAVIDPKNIRGGDKVKAMLELIPCEPSGQKTIGVRLLALQLIEKGQGGEGWGAGFDEEEGFDGGEGAGGGFADESGSSDGPAPKGGSGDADF